MPTGRQVQGWRESLQAKLVEETGDDFVVVLPPPRGARGAHPHDVKIILPIGKIMSPESAEARRQRLLSVLNNILNSGGVISEPLRIRRSSTDPAIWDESVGEDTRAIQTQTAQAAEGGEHWKKVVAGVSVAVIIGVCVHVARK